MARLFAVGAPACPVGAARSRTGTAPLGRGLTPGTSAAAAVERTVYPTTPLPGSARSTLSLETVAPVPAGRAAAADRERFAGARPSAPLLAPGNDQSRASRAPAAPERRSVVLRAVGAPDSRLHVRCRCVPAQPRAAAVGPSGSEDRHVLQRLRWLGRIPNVRKECTTCGL